MLQEKSSDTLLPCKNSLGSHLDTHLPEHQVGYRNSGSLRPSVFHTFPDSLWTPEVASCSAHQRSFHPVLDVSSAQSTELRQESLGVRQSIGGKHREPGPPRNSNVQRPSQEAGLSRHRPIFHQSNDNEKECISPGGPVVLRLQLV